jgi:hypothetical protein
MKKQRIQQIRDLLASVPRTPWIYEEGTDLDHWELYSNKDYIHMVQDDSGVPPDKDFINFVLQAKEIIQELLNEID